MLRCLEETPVERATRVGINGHSLGSRGVTTDLSLGLPCRHLLPVSCVEMQQPSVRDWERIRHKPRKIMVSPGWPPWLTLENGD